MRRPAAEHLIHQKTTAHVPNHPFATYRTGYDALGRYWIEGYCSRCGPSGNWKHQCMNPARTNSWVYKYALQHAHGLVPRRTTR